MFTYIVGNELQTRKLMRPDAGDAMMCVETSQCRTKDEADRLYYTTTSAFIDGDMSLRRGIIFMLIERR
jgi:hypothetical protein